MTKFDNETILGVYGITVVGDGEHAGKIVLKRSHSENRGKSESAMNVLQADAELGVLAATIYRMNFAEKRELTSQMWELVSGGIEDYDADALQAMLRETDEESLFSASSENIFSIETLSPEDINWFTSIVVNQMRASEIIEDGAVKTVFTEQTIHAIGFAIILSDQDLKRLDALDEEYLLISQENLPFRIISMLARDELRLATAAMLIDFAVHSQKRDIVNKAIISLQNTATPPAELDEVLAAAGD